MTASEPAGRVPAARHFAALAVLVAGAGSAGELPFAGALTAHLAATAAFLFLVQQLLAGAYRPSFTHAFAVALVLRLVCLPHDPRLSDDIYRYLHEGRLILAGLDPYAVSPLQTPEALRGPYFALINNPEISAAYPPATQYALAAGALLSPHPIGMKLVFGLCDLLTFVVLWRWLRALGLPAARAIVYGYCPLLALEFAGQGHSDSLGVLFTVSALAASTLGRPRLAVTALAVAVASKLMPGVLLPFLLRRSERPWRGAVLFAVVLLALYAPFLSAPAELFRGTFEYTMRWRSNDSLYALIHAATEAFIAATGLDGSGVSFLAEPQRLSKLPLALLALAVLGVCYARRVPPQRAAFAFFLFFVAAAPTLHPWYVGFLVPFLCLQPRWGLLAFTGTVFLAYHVLPRWHAEGVWQEVGWVKVLEYAPFYLGLAAVLLRPGLPLRCPPAVAGDRPSVGSS